jgi:hypothetical protein
MFKHFPEFDQVVNKTTSAFDATVDFQKDIMTKSVSYFNQITDNVFDAYTTKTVDFINNVSNYAKETAKKSTGTITQILGDSK